MRRLPALLGRATLWGTASTIVIAALVPWEFCMGGDARGLPAAITRPSHEASPWATSLSGGEIHGTEIYWPAIPINVASWTLLATLVLAIGRRFSRHRPELGVGAGSTERPAASSGHG